MFDKYYLSPFVSVIYNDISNTFYLKNILYNNSQLSVKCLTDINPSYEFIKNHIFINCIEKEKTRAFQLLEKKFSQEQTSLGYIETTSICPYKCKICPKGSNLLKRKNPTMDMALYFKIISQLKNQDTLTLHLYGDPLYDSYIYERIRVANSLSLFPNFSTNLLSLKKLDFEELKTCKIKSVIISSDSINEDELSIIRGYTSQKDIQEGLNILENLACLNEELNIIDEIIVQSINLTISKNTRKQIKKLCDDSNSKLKFFEKQFIKFPLTQSEDFEEDIVLSDSSRVFLYNLIGAPIPFKCLKVWKKSEYGITTDGDLVPCCMSFNSYSTLFNANTNNLSEIFASNDLKVFREQIFNGKVKNKICDECTFYSKKIYYEKIKTDLNVLEKYCIYNW